ncbi:MAG: hypothetical protein CVT63_01030 [Candidatus Anoxymicrobium japonicum]|uniref:M23ase beta-sheet core domain-containing protein n=1 Tax=Candidatus Anoxymicrobium japonicum TaxID=2013648 RepID=A0A2N3G7T6_9ACTN|nr:MAG: hypothetical protein CVT63_01030 [Candidatus Anoxymicrobium japonicum]
MLRFLWYNVSMLYSIRVARKLAVICVALAVFVVALVAGPSLSAYAASYNWEGGHDTVGFSAPSGTAYFAEGTTRNGFEEFLLLRNTGGDSSIVTINYLFPTGAPHSEEIELKAWSGASICVNDVIGQGKDVSVAISATPGIIAERQIYFNYKGVWAGGNVACAVSEPEDRWYFAEGTTRAGFQEWLCLLNPSDHEVAATLTYMLCTGETRKQELKLRANSRGTVDVNGALGAGQDASVEVKADTPIIAERPMYFNYKNAWRGGHTSTGAAGLAREWHFAEGTTRNGFEEWLCVMNPGAEASARVEYLFKDGSPVVKDYALKAHSRTTLFVNEEIGSEKDVSMNVSANADVLCERPMYFCYHNAIEGGHNIVGATSGERTWFFPTACSGPGFESWLCVANPGASENKVLVEIFGDGGDYNSEELTMAPRARATFDVNTASANICNPWLKVTGTRDLIAERPTYFSYSPRIDPEPFSIASWAGIEIISPIQYCDLLGPVFHEASADGGDGRCNNCPALQPAGICLRDDNPARLAPGLVHNQGNDPYYFVEETRGRGTYSTTACDVQAKAGTTVYAPVSGTVVAAESYMLYSRYPDLRVKIRIDGHADYQMAILHMSQLAVSSGQRVEAGKTPIGVVRDLVPYFNSGPNPYTGEEGNHAHLQINYRPDQATGAVPASSAIEME